MKIWLIILLIWTVSAVLNLVVSYFAARKAPYYHELWPDDVGA